MAMKVVLFGASGMIGSGVLVRRLFPKSVTTTVAVGRAMIAVARSGAPKAILDSGDINALAGEA